MTETDREREKAGEGTQLGEISGFFVAIQIFYVLRAFAWLKILGVVFLFMARSLTLRDCDAAT